MKTPTQHPELTRADQMLRFFRQSPPGKYPCSQEQAMLIKKYWTQLAYFCAESEFTFNDSFTWLRKEARR